MLSVIVPIGLLVVISILVTVGWPNPVRLTGIGRADWAQLKQFVKFLQAPAEKKEAASGSKRPREQEGMQQDMEEDEANADDNAHACVWKVLALEDEETELLAAVPGADSEENNNNSSNSNNINNNREGEGQEKEAAGDSGNVPRTKANASNIRGVFGRNHGYSAAAYMHSFVMLAPQMKTLDEAIDYHMYLLRAKQLVKESMEAGGSFQHGMRSAIGQINAERKAVSLEKLSLSYSVVVSFGHKSKMTPCTRVLHAALDFWGHLQSGKHLRGAERLEFWDRFSPVITARVLEE
ncbi:unnamed protein product, partial [Polarella glacialis]